MATLRLPFIFVTIFLEMELQVITKVEYSVLPHDDSVFKDFEPTKSLLSRFNCICECFPKATALQLEDGRHFSYSRLDALANQIGQYLTEKFLDLLTSAEDFYETPLVAVMMSRDVGFIATILGILKSGAAYVPIDPAFPSDRQSYIISHSQCKILIADQDCYASAVKMGVTISKYFIVDSRSGQICNISNFHDEKRIRSPRNLKYNQNRLAYVLYTSGSTGKPKGVMVTEAGVANIVEWFANELDIGLDSVVLGLTTFCFDISMLEIFLPLTRGGVLVVANSSTQKDPFRLVDLIKEFKISVFQATPTTYEMMLATGWQGDANVDFLVGGEAFRPTLLPLIINTNIDTSNSNSNMGCKSLRNVYGPTETSIWSLSYTLPRDLVSLQRVTVSRNLST